MKFSSLAIPDVVVIEPQVHGDERGYFMETWRSDQFSEAASGLSFVQENHSRSSAGILRGLHYQLTKPQGKLVRVVRGEVFDVAVDLRRDSKSFGLWVGATLSETNKRQVWVPPGFAHGFLVMSELADFVYKCTDYYAPEDERVIRWDDPDIAIDWPLADATVPLLSDKDAAGVSLAGADVYA